MIVVPVPTEHFGWLLQRTGCVVTSDFRAIAAIDKRGIIQGMVGYCNWTPNAVWMHFAIDNPIAGLSLLYRGHSPAFHYPFVEANKTILLGTVRSTNKRALEIDKRLGFKVFATVPDGFGPGDDMILVRMFKDECKWLKRTPDAAVIDEIPEPRKFTPNEEIAYRAQIYPEVR